MQPLRGDRGSASVWLLACCALVLVAGYVGALRASAVLARHRAEAAADLAALAAAGRIGVDRDPCAAAGVIAAVNGAALTGCRLALAADGRSGTVRVQVSLTAPLAGSRTVSATARAARLAAAPSSAHVPQHQVEQLHRAALVQRVVAVAALG